MRRYLTLFILLVFVVSCCCVSAFASTKNVSVYLSSWSDGDVYGSKIVLEGETGTVSNTKEIHFMSAGHFLSTFSLGYEDGSIFLWSNRSYDLVLENISYKISVPYDGNTYTYFYGERLSRDTIELRVTYVDGTTEVIQPVKNLSNLSAGTNRINDFVYDVSSGTHTLYFSLAPTKDVRKVVIYEHMYLGEDFLADGIPHGFYNMPGVAGFETPLKLSVSENEEYNQTLENINQNQQETNDKLDDVITEQESTNDKLDGFINGDPGVNNPTGSDDVKDMTDAEQNLVNNNNAGLEQGAQMQQNALQILSQYQNAFFVVMYLVNMLYHIPFFNSLLILSLSIGIVAVLLNFGVMASRSRVNHEPKKHRPAFDINDY